MLKVECFSGYKLNERPIAFSLMDRRYEVRDIIDRWYGEGSSYFKVRADDENIYLLKYDEWRDHWDLVLYQNPKKLEGVPLSKFGFGPNHRSASGFVESERLPPLH